LVDKTLDAARHCGARSLALCGGVACNSALRARLGAGAGAIGLKLHVASPKHCTDNGAMIAALGWYQLRASGQPSRCVEASASSPDELRIPFLRK
jgi:N6-L-threonylcarbamoyladenine synthase